MTDYVSLSAITFDVISVLYILYKVKQIQDQQGEKKVREIVRDELEKDEYKKEIKQIVKESIDESDLNKQVNRLILILCTNIPELKRSSLCDS